MKPIVKLNLPPLPKEVEERLLEMANTNNLKYSNDTLLARKEIAKRRGMTRMVAEIDQVQALYGFEYIPTHKFVRLTTPLTDELRACVPTDFPIESDFVIQVIDTQNTFIHDDGSRKVSFYYMMTDDDTAITRFYRSISKPILETTYHPDEVEEYYSIHMEKGGWYMFDHQSIHAVTDVNKLRIGFLVDMSRVYTYSECYEKYKSILEE